MKWEKKGHRLWIRNTSRYAMEEVWPLAEIAYISACRNRTTEAPRIVIKLTNSSVCYCGRAFWTEWHPDPRRNLASNPPQIRWRRILCRIGAPKHFPMVARYPRFQDMPEYPVADHREGLVYIIAHEMEHAFGTPGRKRGETRCEMAAQDAVDLYRSRRAQIDGEIQQLITAANFKSLQRQFQAKAKEGPEAKRAKNLKMLAKWRRKLTLAKNKVKKYERAERRFQKQQEPAQPAPMMLAAGGTQQ